jgi:hypothetical protein
LDLHVLSVKWGTKFSADYVNRLRNMVERNLTLPHQFVCLTDDPRDLHQDIRVLDLYRKDLEYEWTKLLLFDRLPIEGIALYFDLDVVITDNIDCLVQYRPEDPCVGLLEWLPHQAVFNTSVMRFHINRYHHVLDSFDKKVAKGRLQEHREPDPYLGERVVYRDGDRRYIEQRWVSRQLYPRNEIREHGFPEQWVLSYKKHGREGLPPGCKVMVFHGSPKPHEVEADYVWEHWR